MINFGDRMINRSVWATFGRTLRLGSVVEQKKEDGWVFLRIDWKDDEGFENDRQRVIKLSGGTDRYSDWYRVDKINFFNKEDLLNTINKL